MQRRRRPGPARHGPAGMARAGHGMATAAHDNIAPVTHAAIHRRPSPKATLRCALRLQARQRMAARRCYIATAMPCKTRARRRTALRCGTGPLRAGCRRTGGKGVLEYSRRAAWHANEPRRAARANAVRRWPRPARRRTRRPQSCPRQRPCASRWPPRRSPPAVAPEGHRRVRSAHSLIDCGEGVRGFRGCLGFGSGV